MPSLNPNDVTYLEVEQVLDLYADEFGCTSPEQARQYLRSVSALEGALARPLWYAHFREADLALQAAALAHGIAEGQAFRDGNKRIALLVMGVFLAINDIGLEAPSGDLYRWILGLSEGITVDQLADLIRPYLVALE